MESEKNFGNVEFHDDTNNRFEFIVGRKKLLWVYATLLLEKKRN